MTTRKLPLKHVFEELMWFLRGHTNTHLLKKKGVSVWNANATKEFIRKQGLPYGEGDIGPSYGWQFRHSGAEEYLENYKSSGVDQLEYILNLLEHDPTSRRILINLWNPKDIPRMVLPPCGFCYQFYVEDNKLSCVLTQRSSDISLAGGWNIASCSLFVYLLSHTLNLTPNELIWNVGDCHIYENQIDPVERQISRIPLSLPFLYIERPPPYERHNKLDYLTSFEYKDLKLVNYCPMDAIKIPMNA